jgi:dTDP-N-acetylfucosamine:lipid II N-acetylfucosaminyltransferase
MNLHVGKLNKFIPSFMGFCEKEIPEIFAQDVFVFTGDRDQYPVKAKSLKHYSKGFFNAILFYITFSLHAYKANRIVIHGLFEKKILYALFFQPWLLKKCAWMIWGNDLYVYRKNQRKKKRKIEFIRRCVIKRIGYLVTYVAGDVALARQWYNAKGQHINCIMYTSNVFEDRVFPRKEKSVLSIQVGNSADVSNAHEPVFEALSQIPEVDFHVYAPLSYGDPKNAIEVERSGLRLLGDRFTAMKDFMPLEQYYAFLADIDVAIFNHDRQQGMGNIINLLGLRKKVFMRSDVTSWIILKDLGLTVYDVACLDLQEIDLQVLEENHRIIKQNFSKAALASQLKQLLEPINK